MAERTDLNIADFAQLLQESRRALAELRTDPTKGHTDETGEPRRGTGATADQLIRADVVSGGRVEKLHIDPRALRMGAEALAEQVAVAVNAAMDDLRSKSTASELPTVDLESLSDQLLEVQDQSVRRMSMFVDGLDDALDKIARSAGTAQE